jgi:hypothetical protein
MVNGDWEGAKAVQSAVATAIGLDQELPLPPLEQLYRETISFYFRERLSYRCPSVSLSQLPFDCTRD